MRYFYNKYFFSGIFCMLLISKSLSLLLIIMIKLNLQYYNYIINLFPKIQIYIFKSYLEILYICLKYIMI